MDSTAIRYDPIDGSIQLALDTATGRNRTQQRRFFHHLRTDPLLTGSSPVLDSEGEEEKGFSADDIACL